jgi:hypothetical protein
MLSREENELLIQTGAGTPAGNYFRRYWLPALLASEVPAPDCPPVRVRMLGENLPAPAGQPLLGPERRMRAALRLPRMEVRRGGRLCGHAERAPGVRIR